MKVDSAISSSSSMRDSMTTPSSASSNSYPPSQVASDITLNQENDYDEEDASFVRNGDLERLLSKHEDGHDEELPGTEGLNKPTESTRKRVPPWIISKTC
jgi:hypothetical protein